MKLSAYFEALGDKLKADLAATRASLSHAGNKGAKAEMVFRNFLRMHIPRTYDVGHGEVIDTAGNCAGANKGPGQLDVIVIDDAHPRFVEVQEPGLYFVEGVLAAGEVKAALKLSDAEEIISKAAAFKRLRTALGVGDLVFANDEDMDRFFNRRPYFLFAFEAATPLESFYTRIIELESSLGLGPTDHLDAIFLLDRGAAVNLGTGRGGLVSIDANGKPTVGWLRETRPVVIALISWLSEVMPRIVRLSPITRNYLTRSAKQIADEWASSETSD